MSQPPRFKAASIVLGLLGPLAALVVLACHKEEAGPKPVEATGTLAIIADERGFTPSAVRVAQGAPLTLRFTRTTDSTCADKVVFPDAGISKDLPLNTPVEIQVPTDKARTLAFQCGMGMFKSSLVVH